MCGWQVKLCDPLVTHGPYLSALAVVLPIIRRYTNNQITPTLLLVPVHVVTLLLLPVHVAAGASPCASPCSSFVRTVSHSQRTCISSPRRRHAPTSHASACACADWWNAAPRSRRWGNGSVSRACERLDATCSVASNARMLAFQQDATNLCALVQVEVSEQFLNSTSAHKAI